MSDTLQVAIASGLLVAMGPIALAIVNDILSRRKVKETEKKSETRTEAAKEAIATQDEVATVALSLAKEYKEDRNWWRDRALHLERVYVGGSVEWTQ